MLWVTWRQSRAAAIAAGVALLALAAALAITRPGMLSLQASSGLPGCQAHCAADAAAFIDSVKGTSTEAVFFAGLVLTYLTPVLAGVFWGAPLIARELESGTFRLAWNQGVTRQRWAAVKLALLGGAAILTAGLASLMLAWWASPLYHAAATAAASPLRFSRMAPLLFGASGIVPLGSAAFAFALGSAVGVLLRRTVPAMAVTLGLVAATAVLVPVMVRPHLIAPDQSTLRLASVQFADVGEAHDYQLILRAAAMDGRPADWIISSAAAGAGGQAVSTVPPACRSAAAQFLPCLTGHGVEMAIRYQPASRYWQLQSLETAMYLGAAAVLCGLCCWRVRRPAAAR